MAAEWDADGAVCVPWASVSTVHKWSSGRWLVVVAVVELVAVVVVAAARTEAQRD